MTKPRPAPAPKHTRVAVQLDTATAAAVDALIPGLCTEWLRATRSDALRFVVVEGLRAVREKGGAT